MRENSASLYLGPDRNRYRLEERHGKRGQHEADDCSQMVSPKFKALATTTDLSGPLYLRSETKLATINLREGVSRQRGVATIAKDIGDVEQILVVECDDRRTDGCKLAFSAHLLVSKPLGFQSKHQGHLYTTRPALSLIVS